MTTQIRKAVCAAKIYALLTCLAEKRTLEEEGRPGRPPVVAVDDE